MVGPSIEMGIRWHILVKIGIGNKEMDMVGDMVMGIKISREGPMEGLLLKLKHITPPQREGFPMEVHHFCLQVYLCMMALTQTLLMTGYTR